MDRGTQGCRLRRGEAALTARGRAVATGAAPQLRTLVACGARGEWPLRCDANAQPEGAEGPHGDSAGVAATARQVGTAFTSGYTKPERASDRCCLRSKSLAPSTGAHGRRVACHTRRNAATWRGACHAHTQQCAHHAHGRRACDHICEPGQCVSRGRYARRRAIRAPVRL